MGYRIKYLNISKEFDYNLTEANITNLIQCYKYCFTISTFNDAGSSPDSNQFCNSTLAPNLSKVKLENISSGYETFRRINWTSSDSDKCIDYQLEYWTNDLINNTINVNNSKTYQLSNLTANKIYSVRVKPITKFDTHNKQKDGEYSNTVKFYTGTENIFISNLKYSMNWIKRELSLSWNINKISADSLSNYTIDISDQSKNCSKKIIYEYNFNKNISDKSESVNNFESQLIVNVAINTSSSSKIICCNKPTKIFIEIFGTNVMNRHKLNNGTISIEMSKPDPIKNITVNRKDLHSLNLTWVKSDPVDKNKPVMGYRIENLKWGNITNVTDSYFNVLNLNPCTKYCFNISAYNDAGISSGINHCVSTNATNLSEIKLMKISSEYKNSRQIEWQNPENNSCPVYYTVEYWIKNSQNKTKVEIINETKWEINDLKLNEIYEVRVTPFTDFDTANGRKIGNDSNTVEFYTGAGNSGAAVVVSILFILIIGFLIYLAIRNREKLNNYFPFISYFPFKVDSRQSNSENANQKAIQMNEEKSQPVLDERFFDCSTLSEFLNKIDEYQRSLTDFPNYVLFMKENNDVRLIQEYGKLNNLAATLEHQLKLTKFIGKSPFNLKKNRFRNILPFDQNLVYLKSKSAPDNYLNASYIPFSNDDGSVEYIASQGPIESTISDFILMIWEQNIACIVMLTRTYEDDKFKCLQYWPDDLREICRYGNQKEFLVAKLYEKEETSYFERKFSLKNSITHEERIIYHIHMHMWMDFSAPDLKDFCSVLSRFQDMRETMVNSPFLVHCSAGVGRTGTFICIDRIVRLINKGQQYIDVFKSVMELRSSRNLLVQRQSQYIFIHEFLNFYIQKYLTDNIQVVSTV